MRLEHVEVLDVVAEVVVVLAHAQAEGLGDEPERRAVLAAALERPQAQLRVGLGDRRVVGEFGGVLDAEIHHCCCLLLGVGAGRDDARREVGRGDLVGRVGEACMTRWSRSAASRPARAGR